MSQPRHRSKIMINLVKNTARCELCACSRDLEAHHLIPVSLGGPDIEDNIIVVCKGCHAKLTPHNLLTSMKINENREQYGGIFNDIALEFYTRINKIVVEEERAVDFGEVCDILDAVLKEFQARYVCTFRKTREHYEQKNMLRKLDGFVGA